MIPEIYKRYETHLNQLKVKEGERGDGRPEETTTL